MSTFLNRLMEDAEFEKKLELAPDSETRQKILKDEGYEMKGVKEFVERIREDADFMEKVSSCETMQDKMRCIIEEGYYFTKDELAAEQERLAEEEFDTLAGGREAACGWIWEGHCGFTCEPEAWCRDSQCSSHFKCTWG